jgi:hypothetical protein
MSSTFQSKLSLLSHKSLIPLLTITMALALGLASAGQSPDRLKIADGEYLTHTTSPADSGESMRDSWTLWRFNDGHYEVESDIRFDSQRKAAFHLLLSFTRDLHVQTMRMTNPDPDGYSFDAQVTKDFIHVKDKNGEYKIDTGPQVEFYNLLSPWLLSGFARCVPSRTNFGIPMRFVFMDKEGPPDEPTTLSKFWGRVKFFGMDHLTVAGNDTVASKYIIHLGPLPGVVVWLSEAGIVLGTQDDEDPALKTELVQFRKYEEMPELNTYFTIERKSP